VRPDKLQYNADWIPATVVYHRKSYLNCVVRKDGVGSKGKGRMSESETDTQYNTSDYDGMVNGNVNGCLKPRHFQAG